MNDAADNGVHDCLHYCVPGVPDAWVELFCWEMRWRERAQRHRQPISRHHVGQTVADRRRLSQPVSESRSRPRPTRT
eukprot:4252580-Prymnesium_polylepis.1